jgi:Zn-dependent protease with chaperone function
MLESFLAAVADNAVGATVLAVAVFVVTRFWRNPAAQHVLWLLVLVKLITPCVIPLPFGGINVGSVSLTEIPKRPVSSPISSGIEGPIVVSSATEPADRGDQMGVDAPSAATANMVSTEHSLSFVLLSAWLASSGAWLVVAGRRIVQFHRGLKSTAIASTAVQDLARAVANRLGYVSPLEVRIAESQLPPLLWCVGRPKIVLAQGLYSTLGTDELRGILAHEISHLLRRDHWAR